MALLSKEQILRAGDLIHEDVDVPEWGGVVRIQTMTGQGRDRYEQAIFDARQNAVSLDNIRAKLVAACAVDEDGNMLFTEDDVQALGRKSARALDRLFSTAQRVSGVSDRDVEALAKNSAADPSGDSTSA